MRSEMALAVGGGLVDGNGSGWQRALFAVGAVLLIVRLGMVVGFSRRRMGRVNRSRRDLAAGGIGRDPTGERSPGWYPDQTGTAELRWWDGEVWTERTAHRHELP